MGYEVNSMLVGRQTWHLPDSRVGGWLRRLASAIEHRDAAEHDRISAELARLGWTLTRAEASKGVTGESPASADGM
jgi:hypothetical protein